MNDVLHVSSISTHVDDGLVSVVVPTYNRARFLPAAIASVLEQSYADLELIVVDDGSTDDTPEVLRLISDPRMTCVRIAHSGTAAHARNVGLAEARGRYVAFLDSDDVWMPDKLERQMAALRGAPGRRWCYSLFDHIDSAGAPAASHTGGIAGAWTGRITARIVTGEALVLVQSVVVETALLREVGGFDESFELLEDMDLCLRLAQRSVACAIDAVLVRVRRHTGRSTHGRPDVHAWKARALAKSMTSASERSLRTLCRREISRELAALASAHSVAGRPGTALATLASALRHRPFEPRCWTSLAKTLARPIVPAQVVDLYRRLRGTGTEAGHVVRGGTLRAPGVPHP